MVPFIQYSGKEKIKRDRECGFQLTRVLTTKGQHGELFRMMKRFYSSTEEVVTQ